MDFPSTGDNFLQSMLEQLEKSTAHIPKTQQKLMSMTGVAWSDDQTIKVVVGPRGQLVDLEIDPKVFRRPDSAELRAKILKASRTAVEDVLQKSRDVMSEAFPQSEMNELRTLAGVPTEDDPLADVFRSDAEVYANRKENKQ